MSVFRRRRGHPYDVTGAFNDAAEYFSDDAQTFAYYFDDSFNLRYVASDA